MKIVFAASEAAPFIKTGGLGDVAQALPEALSRIRNNDVYLFLPYYSKIKYDTSFPIEFVTSFSTDLSWRKQHVGIFKYKSNRRKLHVYFIDNEYYFGRSGIYGYPDDGERFAYYSKAIAESLVRLDIIPDIIHCNDWQTALLPVFIHSFYQDTLGKAKTVFTIHNIEYQGKADANFLGDTLGLSGIYENIMTFDNCINFMKGSILMCDALTTVSKTYAEEIKYAYYAHGLENVIRDHSFKLSGIVNGIDVDTCDPSTDIALHARYNVASVIEGKASNKKDLQIKLGLKADPDIPLIGMVSRLVSHKGMDLICRIINNLMNWNIQIAILGTGDEKYENYLRDLSYNHPYKLSVNLTFNSALASQIYASSDMYLMPSKSEPCGLSQIIAMRYGTVPIVNATGGLKDTVIPFNPVTGDGLGFTFQTFDPNDLTDAIRRAIEIYNTDKVLWNKLIVNDMGRESSWDKPAQEYMQLYNKLISY